MPCLVPRGSPSEQGPGKFAPAHCPFTSFPNNNGTGNNKAGSLNQYPANILRSFPQSANCPSCVFTVRERERGELERQIKTLDLARDDFIVKVLCSPAEPGDTQRAVSQVLLKMQSLLYVLST